VGRERERRSERRSGKKVVGEKESWKSVVVVVVRSSSPNERESARRSEREGEKEKSVSGREAVCVVLCVRRGSRSENVNGVQ
jgi:hypothetical protein